MLRNFLLLDEQQLNQYISQVEDGLRRASSRSLSQESGGSAEVSAKIARFNLNGRKVDGESVDYADDGPARFERLLALVEGDEDQFGFRDLQADPNALDGIRPGHLLAFAGEMYESDVSRIVNPAGMLSMLPVARALGRLPGTAQEGAAAFEQALGNGTLEAIETFGSAMQGKSIVQGDVLESDWRFVSIIPGDLNIEGDAYVVGKVAKVWGKGVWKPLPGLPIFSQLTREQRRELERKGPTDSSRMMWMEGPALQLDLLAVYR